VVRSQLTSLFEARIKNFYLPEHHVQCYDELGGDFLERPLMLWLSEEEV
jgi:hypothetical protein